VAMKAGKAIAKRMENVLAAHAKARSKQSEKRVHALRVALRRCRSIGGVMREFDRHKSWRKMNAEARALFRALGDMRDIQVQELWVQKLAGEPDMGADRILEYLAEGEASAREEVIRALNAFDRTRWKKLVETLESRAKKKGPSAEDLDRIVDARWQVARAGHQKTLTTGELTAYHELRILIKRLRYVIEDFFPDYQALWGDDLKEMQDLLGEVHDFAVLFETVRDAGVARLSHAGHAWARILQREEQLRIEAYQQLSGSPGCIWHAWPARRYVKTLQPRT
jgi:CHAD domain-containing protein